MKDQWLTSIDIEDMIELGYQVEINRGYYTEEAEPVFKQYILDLFKKKQNSKKGTLQYLLAKLFMNALYGKTIQRPINSVSKYITKNYEYWKFWAKHVITDAEKFEEANGELWLISGIPRDEQEKEERITKPTHYGAFILAYSRRIMCKYMTEANPDNDLDRDYYYTDTDSIQSYVRNIERIKRFRDKTIGGMDDDLETDCKIIRGIWVAPKWYILEYVKKGEEKGKTHFILDEKVWI